MRGTPGWGDERNGDIVVPVYIYIRIEFRDFGKWDSRLCSFWLSIYQFVTFAS